MKFNRQAYHAKNSKKTAIILKCHNLADQKRQTEYFFLKKILIWKHALMRNKMFENEFISLAPVKSSKEKWFLKMQNKNFKNLLFHEHFFIKLKRKKKMKNEI